MKRMRMKLTSWDEAKMVPRKKFKELNAMLKRMT
jgi:hypothetical protein